MDIKDIVNNEQFHEELRRMRQDTSRRKNYREYWSMNDVEMLRNLFNEGVGLSEIAIRMDRSERAIFRRVSKDKLYESVYNTNGSYNLHQCRCPSCELYTNCEACKSKEGHHV